MTTERPMSKLTAQEYEAGSWPWQQCDVRAGPGRSLCEDCQHCLCV